MTVLGLQYTARELSIETRVHEFNIDHITWTLYCWCIPSMARPLDHLVLFSVVATDTHEDGEESLIVQLAWEIVSISKNQVRFK